MRKLFANKKIRYLIIIVLLGIVAVGCNKVTDSTGHTLPEKIITLSTTFGEMMKNEGWFNGLLVWPIAWMINYTAPILGIAGGIIFVTVVINALTFGMTVKSTVSSQKMQILQPELTKLQEKYKDKKDQASQMKMANEMNALYAKHGISPFGSILVLFLQLPIIIAMYQAVQRAEAVVNAKFMGVELTNSPMWGLGNKAYVLPIIFILMVAAQFVSMKLPQYYAKKRQLKTQKGKKTDAPTQNSQGMMMYGMIVMISLLAINMPTAMSLYWMVNSIVNVAKTSFIQWRYIDNEKV